MKPQIHESTNRLAWSQYRNPSFNFGNGLLAHKDIRTGKADDPVEYCHYCNCNSKKACAA